MVIPSSARAHFDTRLRAAGPLILGMPMQRHPLIRIADRAVA